MSVLTFVIIILGLIAVIGILNEKIFHLQPDIALLLFTLIISVILFILSRCFNSIIIDTFVTGLGDFGFEEYLLDGVLCFMLFAGASKVNIRKLRENVRTISLLALLTTMLSALMYGLLFCLISMIFKLNMDILTCILLGCVVSPTDPIAATGILSKIGLSKNVCSVIENESLFNDGTGVTLFIFVRSMILHSGDSNFAVIIIREIVGAVAVGLIVSAILFRLFKITRDPMKYIIISLFDVALVYIICEHMGFSGVIASVVCGMYFSYAYGNIERRVMVVDPRDLYRDFWEIAENMLDSVLFVIIGLLILGLDISKYAAVIIPSAIIINILARAFGVFISTVLTGRKNIPGNYSAGEFVSLMTWSALKGGLSLALAAGTAEFLDTEIYNIFMTVTYTTIFFTVLVQGLTVKKAYYIIESHKTSRIAGKEA